MMTNRIYNRCAHLQSEQHLLRHILRTKNKLIFTSLVLSLFLGVLPASAQRGDSTTPTPTVTATKTKTPSAAQRKATAMAIASRNATATAVASATASERSERDRNRDELSAAAKVKSLAGLKKSGGNAADLRIAAMAKFVADMKTGTCSKATVATQNIIKADMAALSATLTKEKADLAAATTYDAAKLIVQSIFDNRVYLHEIPASRGMCLTSSLQSLGIDKLNKAVTLLKSLGIDTSKIVKEITDAQTSLATAQALFGSVAKTPSGSTAATDLKTAIKNLNVAREAMAIARNQIEALIKNLKTPTPGATVSPTSTKNAGD